MLSRPSMLGYGPDAVDACRPRRGIIPASCSIPPHQGRRMAPPTTAVHGPSLRLHGGLNISLLQEKHALAIFSDFLLLVHELSA